MALPQISRHIRAVGGYGASKERSWERSHVVPVTQQERSRLLCPLRLRLFPLRLLLFPYHLPTSPCSLHPAPTLSQTGCFLPRIHLPAAGIRHKVLSYPGKFLGADPAGEERELHPLCAPFPVCPSAFHSPDPEPPIPLSSARSWQSRLLS